MESLLSRHGNDMKKTDATCTAGRKQAAPAPRRHSLYSQRYLSGMAMPNITDWVRPLSILRLLL
jgi:hypothetical protein